MGSYDKPPNVGADPVSLGQCVVYMNLWQAPVSGGVTPSEDIGAIGKVELMPASEVIKQKQGFPLIKTNEWIKEQTLEFTITGQEENIAKDQYLMGGSTSGETYMFFGGQTTRPVVATRIVKTLEDGSQKIYDIWQARPSGNPKKVFDPEDQNLMEYTFEAEYSELDWIAGDTVATDETLMKITLSPA